MFLLLACSARVPGPLPPAGESVALPGCPADAPPDAPAKAPSLAENLAAAPRFTVRDALWGQRPHALWARAGDTWVELPDGDLAGWSKQFPRLGAGDPREGVLVCVGSSKVGVATRLEIAAGDNPRIASDFQGEPGLPLLAVPGIVLAAGEPFAVELFGRDGSLGSASILAADPLTVRSPELTVACRIGTPSVRYVEDAARTLADVGCTAKVDFRERGLGLPFQIAAVRDYATLAAGDLGWADPRVQALFATTDGMEGTFTAVAKARVAELAPSVPDILDAGLLHGTVTFTCDAEPFPGATAPPGACTVVGDFVADGDLTVNRSGIALVDHPDQVLHTLGLVWADGGQEFTPPSYVAVDGAAPIQVDNILTNDVHGDVVVAVPRGATVRMLFAPVVRIQEETPVFAQVVSGADVVARVRPGRR